MARHRQYQRKIPLSLYGELSEEERRELQQHVSTCEECRKELEGTKKLHTLLARVPAPEAEEALLREARLQFSSALRAERQRFQLWDRLKGLFTLPVVTRPAIGFAIVALLVLGFIGGRLVPAGSSTAPDMDAVLTSGEEIRVTNIRFIRNGASGEDIELLFDAVRSVRLRGSLDNPATQRVLAYALLNGDNAGVRLRAAGSITATTVTPLEREIKAALLLALKTDQNDGVRKEALQALLRYPADREVRDGLLYVLLNDVNPGLRIAAINGLDTLQAGGVQLDGELLQTFRQRVQHDENLYIRVKARSLLEESLQ